MKLDSSMNYWDKNSYGEIAHRHQIINPTTRTVRYSTEKTVKNSFGYKCVYCGFIISHKEADAMAKRRVKCLL